MMVELYSQFSGDISRGEGGEGRYASISEAGDRKNLDRICLN